MILELNNNILALKEERAKDWERAKEILGTAEKEKRELSAEERTNYDKIMESLDNKAADIKRYEAAMDVEKRMAQKDARENPESPSEGTVEERVNLAFYNCLKSGDVRQYASDLREIGIYSEAELRTMQLDNPASGGYFAVPMKLAKEVVMPAEPDVAVERFGTPIDVTGAISTGIRSFNWMTLDDPLLKGENEADVEDTSEPFGRRELTPRFIKAAIPVSDRLIDVGGSSLDGILINGMKMKFDEIKEDNYMIGDGNNKALGLFVASDDGIPTSRDVNSGSATGITADAILDMVYKNRKGYRRNARFLAHRDFYKAARKLKDSNNQYLWTPGLNGGQSDRLAGYSAEESESAPNTFTDGSYVAVFGDLKYYYFARPKTFYIMKDPYTKSDRDIVIVRGRALTDGQPVLGEAFARMKCSA